MNKKLLYGLLAVLVLIYLVTIFVFQPDQPTLAKYNVNATTLRLISLVIVIPIFAFWFAAVYALVHVGKYYQQIKSSVEAEGFKFLMIGLAVLGFGQAFNSILGRVLPYLATKGVISREASTIITTHMNVLVLIVSFGLFFYGSYKLVGSIKKVKLPSLHSFGAGLVLASVSSIYAMTTMANPSRTHAVAPVIYATYAIPDWLIITTIVLPYILVWSFGIYAVLFLRTYYQNVRGVIYKKALTRLNIGFLATIFSSVVLQFTSAAANIIQGWALSALLALVFVLIAVMAVGYIYIALGAKKLSKLEDVT